MFFIILFYFIFYIDFFLNVYDNKMAHEWAINFLTDHTLHLAEEYNNIMEYYSYFRVYYSIKLLRSRHNLFYHSYIFFNIFIKLFSSYSIKYLFYYYFGKNSTWNKWIRSKVMIEMKSVLVLFCFFFFFF
jgi:hypothetical protein